MAKGFYLLFFFLLNISVSIFAKNQDSLDNKSDQYLVSKIDTYQFDRKNPLVKVYLNAYIKNAKRNHDYETLTYAYKSAVYYNFDKDVKLQYADSALISAQKTKNIELIGDSYHLIGSNYYQLRDYKQALDYYILANNTIKASTNEFLKHKILYGIAVVKLYLGYYQESLEDLITTTKYFSKNDDPDYRLLYLRSLYRTSEVYLALHQYPKAAEINLLGLQESIKFEEKIQEQYFNLAIGIDDYYAENFALAIENISKTLSSMKENGYFEMEEKGHYYIANSYLKLKLEKKALHHFQQIDFLFNQHEYLPNELRETYEWLIDYYKKENDKDKQIYYINQLLIVDNINKKNNQYLAYKLNRDYDTQRLLEEKKKLERKFLNWQYYAIISLIIILVTTIYYVYQFKKIRKDNQILYKQYKEIISQTKHVKTIDEPNKKVNEIPKEVVTDILKKLEEFENNHEYLNKKIDQKYLADKFKTNTTYLSKIINSYKENNFNGYVNKLRINYIIELLKKDPKYRNYTIDALGETAGFSSYRHFSNTFYSETGLRPTYFLEQIRKEVEVTEL